MTEPELHHIAVIGAGMMGRSIVTKVSQSGLSVIVREISEARAGEVRKILEHSLDRQIERWSLTQSEKKATLSRIEFTTDLAALKDAQLVVETIQEDFDAKRSLLAELDATIPAEIPIIVNTSSLSITELAREIAHPERVLGIHFLYPATTTPVAELVRGQVTSNAAFATARAFVRVLGKVPIEVFESPGFVTTRIMLPLINESIHVVMEGVASAAEVDLAMKLGYEFRTGPLEWADRVGLDKVLNWMELIFRETGEARFRPCPLLRKLVRAGHYGARVGKGFFTYDKARERLDRLADDTPRLS
jgi:3-hydroxybutyryl-CoA dehydrogenase